MYIFYVKTIKTLMDLLVTKYFKLFLTLQLLGHSKMLFIEVFY